MKKKVLFILFILILIFISYTFLTKELESKLVYEYIIETKPLLINKKELIIDNVESFIFDEFFDIYSLDMCTYKYNFNDSYISVSIYLKDNIYNYNYEYSIKEKEIIEIIKEVYIEKQDTYYNNNNLNVSHPQKSDYVDNNEFYFEGYCDLYFNVGCDIQDIIYALTTNIKTNMQVAVDYSELNPNCVGQYNVRYILPNDIKTILVTIS